MDPGVPTRGYGNDTLVATIVFAMAELVTNLMTWKHNLRPECLDNQKNRPLAESEATRFGYLKLVIKKALHLHFCYSLGNAEAHSRRWDARSRKDEGDSECLGNSYR